MSQKHSPTTVTCHTDNIQRLVWGDSFFKKTAVSLPLVGYNLATRETADWDDHWLKKRRKDVEKIVFFLS
jgi:hypothetical protein